MENLERQEPMSNLQLELLKLYAQKVSDVDLLNIKQMIAEYFAEKAMDMADKIWDEKGWDKEDSERLANTRMRTAYNSDRK